MAFDTTNTLDTAQPGEPVILQSAPPAPQTPAQSGNSRQPRIIAMMNQKGGVGKTTSTVNLGAALARAGKRVLLIDLDPQAHLTLHVGIDPTELEISNYDLLTDDKVTAGDVIHHVQDNLWVLPAEVNLAGAETELAPKMVDGRAQRVLQNKLASILSPQSTHAKTDSSNNASPINPAKTASFPLKNKGEQRSQNTEHSSPNNEQCSDSSEQRSQIDEHGSPEHTPLTCPPDYILIDCPPSLGLLTINALNVAREVFVPMQAHFLALQGLSKLLETVGFIRGGFNPDLRVTGILLCMFEKQTILAGEVTADLEAFLEANRNQETAWSTCVILKPAIRRNIKLAESPSFGTTIYDYANDSNGAADYKALAESVIAMPVGK
jgi:cellulose biosynthesis protein BcsQ